MKKTYETPNAEMISFQYQEQVVASNADNCPDVWVNIGSGSCTDGNPFLGKLN